MDDEIPSGMWTKLTFPGDVIEINDICISMVRLAVRIQAVRDRYGDPHHDLLKALVHANEAFDALLPAHMDLEALDSDMENRQ